MAKQNKCDDAVDSADAPSQAHLQGTQSRHTEANLAKEPALFQRFRDTPCHGGYSLSIQVTKKKGEHTTGSWLLCWQTNIFSASYRYQPISSRRNKSGRMPAEKNPYVPP
jgi:hypothetical protein